MTDCIGNELNIGDNIVCSDGYYSELLLGKVIEFTDKMIVCRVVRSSNQQGEPFKTRKYPYQVHLIHFEKGATKKSYINDSADTPYIDYYCSRCGNKDSICEEDLFCRQCGAKFLNREESQ